MYNLEILQQFKYCSCGEIILENSINEYCDVCNQIERLCIKCDRQLLGCFLKNGICWDCVSDEQSTSNENLKCNFCGNYSSTPMCWTCENNNKELKYNNVNWNNNNVNSKKQEKEILDAKIKIFYDSSLIYDKRGQARHEMIKYLKKELKDHRIKVYKFEEGFYVKCKKENSSEYVRILTEYKTNKEWMPSKIQLEYKTNKEWFMMKEVKLSKIQLESKTNKEWMPSDIVFENTDIVFENKWIII